MRPIATQQNVIQFPLNELFGTPANVRLIRLLAEEAMGPVGAAEAADRTGLTLSGAKRALMRLVKTGFVQRVGSGRSPQFALRESDPISNQIRNLFRNESERYQSLISQIRKALDQLSEIQATWIDSPPTEAGKPLQIGILSDSRSLTYLGDQVRQRVAEIEREFDVTIELRTFSRADTPELFVDRTELLTGNLEPTMPASGRTHDDRDKRAVRFSTAIAEMLDRDPSLIKRATRHLEFLLQEDQGSAAHDLREWRDILAHYSQQRIKDFLFAETPRAQRLRQSSPFFAVLSPDERDIVLSEAEKNR
jgi:predicted transcriptional regulator